jgi:hypothetical protein
MRLDLIGSHAIESVEEETDQHEVGVCSSGKGVHDERLLQKGGDDPLSILRSGLRTRAAQAGQTQRERDEDGSS